MLMISANKHPFKQPLPDNLSKAGTRKLKPVWILIKQEIIDGVAVAPGGLYANHLRLAADR